MASQSVTIFCELVGGHAGVRRHDELDEALLAGRGERLHVAFEYRLERLRVFPLGMLRRQRLDAVEREGELDVHRLLGPERAVVVEDGDALGWRHEVGRRPAVVTAATKSTMACFAAPSFQDGSGSRWPHATKQTADRRRQ